MRLSEIAAGVGVVCLLLAVLTWLLMRGIATDAAAYSTALRTFDDFALGETSLDRDVLRARAGLLTDYDPLVRSSERIAAAVSQLRVQVASEGLDPKPVERLAAAIQVEENLTERFKSDNALLRNSLSYVGLLSASPEFNDRDIRLRRLARAILLLTLDSSARSQQGRVFSRLQCSPRPRRIRKLPRLSFLTLASLKFFVPQSTIPLRGCSPFRPDSLWRRRARNSRVSTRPRKPRRNGFACSSMSRRFYSGSRSSILEDGSGSER